MAVETAPPAPAPAAETTEQGNVPSKGVSEGQESAFSEAFADLDKAFGEEPKSPVRQETPTTKPTDKGDKGTTRATKPDGKPAPAKPAEPKKDEPKPAEPSLDKMAPKQLRDAYEQLRRKHAQLEEEHKKARSAPPKPQDDPEKLQLTERLTEREKRLQEYEQTLRETNYERSQEYKEKFEQPFISAWQAGQERSAKLKVVAQFDDMQNPVSEARQGTHADFDTLMQFQDDDEAAEWAAKTFGTKAPMLLFHRERVQEANNARRGAIDNFKKNGNELEKQRWEKMQNDHKTVRGIFEKSLEQAYEKYPQFFRPDDNDPKTKALLDKGYRLADRALGAPDVDGEKPLSPEDRIRLTAAMRNSFGAFQRLAYDLSKERATRAELEKRLAEYEDSEPKGGEGRGSSRTAPAGEPDTAEAAFDAHFGTGS